MTNQTDVFRTDSAGSGQNSARGKRPLLTSVLAITLTVLLVVYSIIPMGLSTPSFAAPGEESGAKLKSLGVVKGDGQGNLLLDRHLTRVELAILLSRLHREEWKASTYTAPSAFKDESKFPEWGARYIAYSQHRGWLAGDGNANFNAFSKVSGEELAVLMLRVLGYGDMPWGKNAAEFQKQTGIAMQQPMKPMLRRDLFDVLWEAISKPVMKDGTALLDTLGSTSGLEPGSKEQKICNAVASMVRLDGYDTVGLFHNGYALVTRQAKGGGYEAGFIDVGGNLVVSFDEKYTRNSFMGMNRFSDGRSAFVVESGDGKRNKHGYIDPTGKVVIPPKYDDASVFEDGIAYVKEGDSWYYIDVNGNVVFEGPKGYQAGGVGTRVSQMPLYYFEDGLAMIRDSMERSGFIDRKGNVFIKPSDTFDRADFFAEDLAVVVKRGPRHDEKWGFINKKGELVVETIYDEAFSFSEGLAAVRMGTFDCPSWGYIDKSGKVVIPLQFCYAGEFKDGLAFVANGGMRERKGGYIDKTGKAVIPFEYTMGRPFEEDRAVVMKDGYFGYIDKTGRPITEFVFDSARSFEDGVAIVSKNERQGMIGLDGLYIIDPIYDTIFSIPGEDIYVLKIGRVHWILNLDLD